MKGRAHGPSAGSETDAFDTEQSPLGNLMGRATQVARVKERVQQLRDVWPAMSRYAEDHQGLLPTNMVALQAYLPPRLTNLSDDRWEMPSAGLVAQPLMQKNDVVLLAQKNIPPGKPRIVVFGDGHIEYK
jgi:hypothetical protein